MLLHAAKLLLSLFKALLFYNPTDLRLLSSCLDLQGPLLSFLLLLIGEASVRFGKPILNLNSVQCDGIVSNRQCFFNLCLPHLAGLTTGLGLLKPRLQNLVLPLRCFELPASCCLRRQLALPLLVVFYPRQPLPMRTFFHFSLRQGFFSD